MAEEDDKKYLIDESEQYVDNKETSAEVQKKNLASEDNKQMNNFLGPMMKELEDAINEQMKYLDKIEEDLMGDSKLEEYNRLVGHIPQQIRGCKSINEVFKNLGSVLNETIEPDYVPSDVIEKSIKEYVESKKTERVETLKLEELTKLASFSSYLCSFLLCKYSRKSNDKINLFTSKIYDSVNLWISKLFRFKNSALLFYDDETEGFVRLCHMLLNYKCSGYKENGFEGIKKKPLIYISEASKYSTTQSIQTFAAQLGFPVNCFKVAQVSKKLDDNFEKIDTRKFEKSLEEDLKNNFTPIALITSAGNHRSGHCDNLNEINRICYKYRVWLHLDGFYLSTLSLYSVPTAVQPIWSGDSVTLDLASWLGIPCLAYITIYRNVENSNSYIQPFNNFKTVLQRSFPYWSILQAIGHDGVIGRIRFTYELSNSFNGILEKQKPYLKMLNFIKTEGTEIKTSFHSLGDLFAKALSFLTFVDLNNPVTIFKCDTKFVNERLFLKIEVNETKQKRILSAHHQEFLDMIHEKPEPKEEVIIYSDEIIEYTNSLTTWLYESINEKHKMEFELVKIENEGICIRYCPIEHANVHDTKLNDLKEFDKSIEQLMKVIDSSIRCKARFNDEIKEYVNLIPVKVADWAGVGAFRYIPDYLINKIDEINNFFNIKSKNENIGRLKESLDKELNEVNSLNELIIKKLQSSDNAFSSGEATDGFIAIEFGMIQDISSLKKLFNQVLLVSKEIEESSRFIETMSNLVRQGIEKANKDLKKETEQKSNQEGIFRQIPLVGGLFSWISPSTSVNSVGRTFNLQSGKILTTESIYKYHIQVEEDNVNNLSTEVDLNEERKLSSDTLQINLSDQTSQLSSEEQRIHSNKNTEALLN